MSTYEVEVVRGRVDDLVALLRDSLHVRGRDPDEDRALLADSDIMVKDHF